MRVTGFTAEGFRNLQQVDLQPGPGVNLIYGPNAQGKTNLLEALWLFTGGRSFRGAREGDMIAFDRDRADLAMEFEAEGRDQKARITLSPRRTAVLNGVEIGAASRLAGRFCGVVFSPAHLSLVKSGPENRRRFVDGAYCQLRPSYIGALTLYERVLQQRNGLLRLMRQTPSPEQQDLLEVYDGQLALAGARLIRVRGAYLAHISEFAREIYAGLSQNTEELGLTYCPSGNLPWEEEEGQIRRALAEGLTAARSGDLAAGFSTLGPHRDDFEVTVNGLSARVYGSQGQQRSAVLALKLAEAAALREVTGEQPVALLDDVMSELDEGRQDYLLNRLQGVQVFVTCCEPSSAMRLAGGDRFRMSGGKVEKE